MHRSRCNKELLLVFLAAFSGSLDTVCAGDAFDFSFVSFEGNALATLKKADGILNEGVPNPDTSGVNGSPLVGEYQKTIDDKWDQLIFDTSSISIDDAADYAKAGATKFFYIDVYSPAPVGATVQIRLLDNTDEVQYPDGIHSRFRTTTTKQNEWERLKLEFRDRPDTSVSKIKGFSLQLDNGQKTSDVWYIDNIDSYTVADDACPDTCVCKVSPDPHFTTWSRVKYDFHEGCDLVFINNPGFPAANGLDLHIRTLAMGGYAGVSHAVLRIGSDRLEVANDDTFLVNGLPTAVPESQGVIGTLDGYPVTVFMTGKFAPEYKVQLNDGQNIRIFTLTVKKDGSRSLRVAVKANVADFGQSTGLCGTWCKSELFDRSGTLDLYPVEPPATKKKRVQANEFGRNWQVDPGIDTQLFQQAPPIGQTCQNPQIGPGSVEGVDRVAAAELAVEACGDVGDEDERLNCEFDVETTGNAEWREMNPDYTEAAEAGAGGDPHFHTFHGQYYAYHGICDLVLVHSSKFAGGIGLDIHVRTEERDGYSSISNAAIRIGSDVFEVVNDGTHFVNGVPNVKLPARLAGVYDISKTAAIETDVFLPDVSHGFTKSELTESILYDVDLGSGENIQIQAWKDYLWVNVRASPSNFEDCVGLMGTWGKPGMIGRDGVTNFEDATKFGEEWQVLGTEPKLFQTWRAPQHPQTCFPAPTSTVARRLGQEHSAEAVCSHVSGPKKRFCIFDVLATGDLAIAQAYRKH